MSRLRINASSKAAINPEFSRMFVAIAEEDADAAINIIAVNAFLEVTDENRQENTDIQNMAVFLLLSGEVLAVKWDLFYFFGDVDRMDNEFSFDEDSDNVTLIQYELEDEDGEEG